MESPLLKRLAHNPLAGSVAALLILFTSFSLASDRFLTGYNISLILQQSVVVGILGVAQTLVILTAGIDLSIGAICVLGTIVLARSAELCGWAPALLATVAVCTAVGCANGLLVSKVKLPPFIVTLGMLTIVAASTQLLAGSSTYQVPRGPLTLLGYKVRLLGFETTLGVITLLALYALAWYVLSQTAGGRHIYAVGGSPEAARLAGIKSGRSLFSAYAISGLIATLATWAALGRIPNADPNAFQTANLDTITAVVIGGTSLFGGRGSVLGTLVGTLIVGILRNGLTLVGVDNLYQNIATGALVILAVTFDQFTRRRTQ